MSNCDKRVVVRYENVISVVKETLGWTQQWGYEPYGDGFVTKLIGYIGGEGIPPTENIGNYVGIDGFVEDISDAVVHSEKGNEGLSAYQIAVNNGFEGTEQEWLDSLKGKDGVSPVIATISPTDPSPTKDGMYLPTVTQNEAGTPIVYPNAGGLTVNTAEGGEDYGMGVQLIKNGTVWVKNSYPLPKSETSLYNVSKYGESFALASAINTIPLETRQIGLNITFIKDTGSWIQYRYAGYDLTGFEDVSNWQVVQDEDEKLLNNSLNKEGNTEEVLFNAEGDISSVIYKDSQEVTIRTDTYQYAVNQITQTQTLPNGYSRAFLTNLDTLKTIRLDASYTDLVIYPFDYYFGGGGWQYEGSATLVDGRVNLKGFPSIGVLSFATNPLKNNTLYGFLLKVEGNTLSSNFIMQSSVSGTFPVIATSGQNGYRKLILTSRPDTIIAKVRFQTQSTESPTGEVYFSEVRIFELRPNSQIKIDFETLTPDQLNLKYPKQ